MLIAYLVERVPPRRFLPIAAFIAMAASGGIWGGAPRLVLDTGLAFLLLVQFRIWDDLADRSSDATAHPERVVVGAGAASRFGAFAVLLGAANLLAAARQERPLNSFAALLALNGLMAVHYGFRSGRTIASDHVLLAKYPLMVFVIAARGGAVGTARVVLAMGVVYLAACLYEAWHDPTSPAAANRPFVASEAILLLLLTIALSIGGLP